MQLIDEFHKDSIFYRCLLQHTCASAITGMSVNTSSIGLGCTTSVHALNLEPSAKTLSLAASADRPCIVIAPFSSITPISLLMF